MIPEVLYQSMLSSFFMYQLYSSVGSFLTLGIGGNAETMSSSNFRIQDATSKLEGTLSFQHNSQGDLAVSPLPCSSTSIVHPDYTSVTALTSESSKPTLFSRQPISDKKHNYFTLSSMNGSSDSSLNSHLLRHQGSSTKHAQLGESWQSFFFFFLISCNLFERKVEVSMFIEYNAIPCLVILFLLLYI